MNFELNEMAPSTGGGINGCFRLRLRGFLIIYVGFVRMKLIEGIWTISVSGCLNVITMMVYCLQLRSVMFILFTNLNCKKGLILQFFIHSYAFFNAERQDVVS